MVRTVVELDADVAIAYDSYGLVNKLPLDRKVAEIENSPKSRGFRPYHEINIALQELKQRHKLIE
jgi:hypothetical protein